MKLKFLSVAAVSLFSLSAFALGDLQRDSNGRIRYMRHSEAAKACPSGTRLPTMRELAKDAEDMGAKGILELHDVDPYAVPIGFSNIGGREETGALDVFYYSRAGFVPAKGELENAVIWASTVSSDFPRYAAALVLHSGHIIDEYDGNLSDGAAACVPKPE